MSGTVTGNSGATAVDYPGMTRCTDIRDALSARLDGEASGVNPSELDAHLRGCDDCRAFGRRIGALHRSMRVAPAPAMPDLTAPILASIAAEQEAEEAGATRDLFPRLVLAAIGILQLVLSVPALVLGDDADLPVHTARHLGSFGAALAIGFLYVAWKPSRVHGLLPVLTALVACLVGTSIADVMGGTTPVITEAQHLAEIVGVAAMWLLAHPATLRARPIVPS
jgi:predicted anti-sigma-YlaC factor YlaD